MARAIAADPERTAALTDLRRIPGVGPSIADDLWRLGVRRVVELRGRDPEELYGRFCALVGGPVDRCLLYVFRCAVYFAQTPDPDPERLRWWYWKDKPARREPPDPSRRARAREPGRALDVRPRGRARASGRGLERAGTMTGARPPAARWAAVLFDLDGTLADTVGLILSCYRHTMRTHRGEVLPDEAWIRGMGTPLREQLGAFARSHEELDAMLLTYGTYQRAHHDAMVAPYPEVPALLDALEAAGVPCALVTSRRPELTQRTLRHCGILRHFQVIVTPDDVQRAKPHPEPVLVALARLGSPPPERVLFVGDSPHDIESGRAAGVRTAGALWGPFSPAAVEAAHPDYLAHRPLELLDLTP